MTEDYKNDKQQQTARNTNTEYGKSNTSTTTTTSKNVKPTQTNVKKAQKSSQNCGVGGSSCSTNQPKNKGWNN